jgi:class 3 adenylate cyclase
LGDIHFREPDVTDALVAGRKAIQSYQWEEAVRSLEEADKDTRLDPEDLVVLGDAYWWVGQPDSAIKSLERAFSAYLAGGRHVDAALAGTRLAYYAMRRSATPVAMGWISRVEHLLADQPESESHAWLALLNLAKTFLAEHDLDATLTTADEVIELAQRLKIPGVQALAMSFKGTALIQMGNLGEGTKLVDEATVVAISQGSDLHAASNVYCNTIWACSTIGDYDRAQVWTDEAERWMANYSVGGYTGVCQVHRAELKRLHGSWPEAEEFARNACVDLERFHLLDAVGFAHYEIGETRRRMGDVAAAQEAFAKADEYGYRPEPGASLLLLDKGDVAEAAVSIEAAVGRRGDSQSSVALVRGHLLPAQVEIAIRVGDLKTASAATEELEDMAGEVVGKWWSASALTSRGQLQAAEGSTDAAIETLDRAWRIWQEIEFPYESARARATLGKARIDSGDERGGLLDLEAARSTFRRLGARGELKNIAGHLGEDNAPEERDRVTRVFMFTDIVTSTDLIGLIGDTAWESLLEWHDRTLRETFARHDGEVVKHTGDGFLVTFDSARSAIDCAVMVQRTLADHRKQHGFAPRVRIGLHLAEATRMGADYAGQGVHAAARIGTIGDEEDIVVSNSVIEAAGQIPYRISEGREVALKGIKGDVLIHDLAWK